MSEQCRHTETQHFGADVHRCSRCGEIVEDRPMIAIPPVGECTFCRRSILECRCEAATREGPAQDMRVRYALRHDVIAHKAYTLGQCEGRDRIRELESRLAAAEAALAVRVELLARADGLLSLIYHRYQYEKIPHDIRENMLRTSYELRALTDAAAHAPLP